MRLDLDPVQAGRLDLVAAGFLPAGTPVRLRSGEVAAATGDLVELHDLEGVRLGTLHVAEAGPGWLTGIVSDPRRPERPDHPALRRTAAEARALVAGWPTPVTALIAAEPPTPDAFADAVRAAGGRLAVAAVAAGAPEDAALHRRVRAWQRLAAAHGPDVVVTLLAASPDDPAAVAVALGADRLADPPPADPAVAHPRSGGATVLFTGLSGSGKSTIAGRLVVRLLEAGRTTTLLDGDVVRTHLSRGLGFGRADRDTNVRRIGWVAAEVTKHGGIAVCAPIAPYDETRKAVRAMVEEHGAFVLVHVATPLAECEARDRKGLYAKARAGEIAEFTGISDPYDEPTDAELVVHTEVESADAAADRVLAHLRSLGVV